MRIEDKVWNALTHMNKDEMTFIINECCDSICVFPMDGKHLHWFNMKHRDKNLMDIAVKSLFENNFNPKEKWAIYTDNTERLESVSRNDLLNALEKYRASIIRGILNKDNEYFFKKLAIKKR